MPDAVFFWRNVCCVCWLLGSVSLCFASGDDAPVRQFLRDELQRLEAQPQNVQIQRERADALANAIRSLQRGELDPAARDALAQTILVEIDKLQSVVSGDLSRQLNGDKILVLYALRRYQEAGDLYLAMREQYTELREYEHDAGGAALLSARKPQLALEAYRSALSLDTDNDDYAVGVFYGLVEIEQIDEAILFAANRATDQSQSSERYYLWKMMQARGLGFANQTAQALAVLEQLEPNWGNREDFLALRGTLLRWQDRPQQALHSFERAADLHRGSIAGLTGLVSGSVGTRNYTRAAQEADRLTNLYADDAQAIKTLRSLALDRGWRIATDFSYGDSDAVNSPLGAEDQSASVIAHSRLLANHWRIFAGYRDQSVEIPAQELDFGQSLIGVSFVDRALAIELGYAHGNHLNSTDDSGLFVSFDYRLSDSWSASVSHTTAAWDVPLRARALGIGAVATAATLAYTPRYGHRFRLYGEQLELSDENDRDSIGLSYQHTWLEDARWRVNGTISLYHSGSSRTNRPYFSPVKDDSLDYSLRADFLSWRRYESAFYQYAGMVAGRYQQDDFDTGSVIGVEYGHRWRWAPRAELGYGITWRRRPYDGADEDRLGFSAYASWELP